MAMTNEDCGRLEPIVKSTARREWKHSDAMSAEDLEQDLWVWVLSRWDKLQGKDLPLIRFEIRRAAGEIGKKARLKAERRTDVPYDDENTPLTLSMHGDDEW